MHDYAVKNIGRGVFMKAKLFKTVKEFKKFVDDNRTDIIRINKYLYDRMDDYYDRYIDIAYKWC